MEFESYLAEHVFKHPSVCPQDIVKLCYQAAYGAEHLLCDRKEAQKYLEEEYASVEAKDTELYENISDNVCRVNLAAWKYRGLPLQWLFRLFVDSASVRNPGGDMFPTYLKTAGQAVKEGMLPFDTGDWERYLTEYRQKPLSVLDRITGPQRERGTAEDTVRTDFLGDEAKDIFNGKENFDTKGSFPEPGASRGGVRENDRGPVHHSTGYRESERPAYRLVDRRYIRLFPVLEKAWELSDGKNPCVIAIDGRAAAGKSTMAKQLERIMDASMVRMDDFFLPPALRTPRRYAQPGGNVHYERFQEEVLPFIAVPEYFSYRIFDCGKKDYNGECRVENRQFRIVEGSYSCHPLFGRYASVTVFLDVEPKEQMRRISLRNGEAMAELFRKKWIPLEEKYFEECRIAENADIRLMPLACME